MPSSLIRLTHRIQLENTGAATIGARRSQNRSSFQRDNRRSHRRRRNNWSCHSHRHCSHRLNVGRNRSRSRSRGNHRPHAGSDREKPLEQQARPGGRRDRGWKHSPRTARTQPYSETDGAANGEAVTATGGAGGGGGEEEEEQQQPA